MEVSVKVQASALALDVEGKKAKIKCIKESCSGALYIVLCVATLGIAHFVQWCRERILTKAIEKLKSKIVSLQPRLSPLERAEAAAERQKAEAAALSAETTVVEVADHDTSEEEPVDQLAPALTSEVVEEKQDTAPVKTVDVNAPFTVEGFLDIPFMTFFETAFSNKQSLAYIKTTKGQVHFKSLKKFGIVKIIKDSTAFYEILFDVWNQYVHLEQNEMGPQVSLSDLFESESDCVERLPDVDAWIEGNKDTVTGLVKMLDLNRGSTVAPAAAAAKKKPHRKGKKVTWADEDPNGTKLLNIRQELIPKEDWIAMHGKPAMYDAKFL